MLMYVLHILHGGQRHAVLRTSFASTISQLISVLWFTQCPFDNKYALVQFISNNILFYTSIYVYINHYSVESLVKRMKPYKCLVCTWDAVRWRPDERAIGIGQISCVWCVPMVTGRRSVRAIDQSAHRHGRWINGHLANWWCTVVATPSSVRLVKRWYRIYRMLFSIIRLSSGCSITSIYCLNRLNLAGCRAFCGVAYSVMSVGVASMPAAMALRSFINPSIYVCYDAKMSDVK